MVRDITGMCRQEVGMFLECNSYNYYTPKTSLLLECKSYNWSVIVSLECNRYGLECNSVVWSVIVVVWSVIVITITLQKHPYFLNPRGLCAIYPEG